MFFTIPFLNGGTNHANMNESSIPDQHYMVNLRDVHKAYKTSAGDYPVLKGIDLQIGRGEFVSIIGKSGSGKSTLLNMITGIDRPTSGEIHVNEMAVHQLKENKMARWRGKNMGIVFQFFQLLPMLSILENVMLPMDFCNTFPKADRRKRAMDLLDRVELADHAFKLPSAISGGQQQRVAIARALINDPPVIIADEPTGNLDSRTADSVFELFNQLVAEGKTIIVVTHDSSLAKRATRTALIADGEIANEYMTAGLKKLPADQAEQIRVGKAIHEFEPGTIVMQPDSDPQTHYLVLEGTVEIILKRENAADVVVGQLGQGYCFNPANLAGGKGHTALARAYERGKVQVALLQAADLEIQSAFAEKNGA
jgi:putative ABC transport system ATP-binding protein